MGLDLTLSTYALIGGSVVTSNVLFSNISTTAVGVVPLLNGRFGPIDIRVKDKVDIWTQFFKKASVTALASVALTAACSTVVYLNHPSAFVRKLSVTGAICSALVVPYTVLFLAPTNSELFDIHKSGDLDTGVAGDENPRAKHANALLDKWEKLHNVRYLAFISGWALALTALVMDNRA